MKKALSVILAVLLVVSAIPTGFATFTANAESAYSYVTDEGFATITGVDTTISGDIVIPDFLGGCPVTAIGPYAFQYCTNITSVSIHEGVTSIAESAFEYCDALRTAWLPESLSFIGSYAFANCQNLESIILPENVTEIVHDTFYNCPSLIEVYFSSALTSIGDYAFAHCVSLGSLNLPSSITNIECAAFSDCISLTDVYYTGSSEDRAQIFIAEENEAVWDATWHYYSAPVGPSDPDEPTCDHNAPETFLEIINDGENPFVYKDNFYTSTNKGNLSYSIFTAMATADLKLNISYYTSSEHNYDKLTISQNGTLLVTTSGESTVYYLTVDMKLGDMLTFEYSKDGSASRGTDEAFFRFDSFGMPCEQEAFCHVCGELVKANVGHIYDDEYDAVCNECGEIREVEGGEEPDAPDQPVFPECVWDGSTQTAPIDSDDDGVYEINTAEELAYIIDNNGTVDGNAACSFILTADIYLNDISKINWTTGEAISEYTINSWFRYWKSGSNYHQFAGTIDGNGHTVYGLYVNMPNEGLTQYDAAALIPGVAANATVTIKNLGIDNAYVNFKNGAAAFVGYANNNATVKISNSFAGANVTLIGNDAGVFRAVARQNKDCVLENCYSLATTTGVATYGLIGFNWEVSKNNFVFRNCYNANGPLNFGGAPGYNCTAENSYSTADNVNAGGGNWLNIGSNLITADKMQGLDVFTDASKMPSLNADGAYVATDGYPALKVFEEIPEPPYIPVPDYVWDGSTSAPAMGMGTEAEPYIIATAEELAYIISNGGGANTYYKLANDIYLNDVEYINWTTGTPVDGYTPNQWYDNASFQGIIDGDGHVVYGLYFKTPNDSTAWGYCGVGLVPRVDDGTSVTVKNLGVDKAYVAGQNGASAFVGFVGPSRYDSEAEYANVNIDRCYVGENVCVSAYIAGAFVGAGYKGIVDIKNAYSLGEINTVEDSGTQADVVFGGFVGNNWNMTVSVNNSYNAKGVIFAWWNYDTFSSSNNNYATGYDIVKDDTSVEAYYATKVDVANMQGLDVFTDSAKMPELNADRAYVATEGYPVLRVFTDMPEPEEPYIPAPDYVWDGTTSAPTMGMGTEAEPYIIATAEELAYIISNGGGADTYYKLANDIYLNAVEHIDWTTGVSVDGYTPYHWYDNASFQGIIDGDGHVVYGLYFKRPNNSTAWGHCGVGLIPRVDDGTSVTVKNLGVENAFVSGYNGASAFVGFAGPRRYDSEAEYANVNFDRCYVGENVTIRGNDAGAFRGATCGSETTITNSYSLATLSALDTSGLIGNLWNAEVAIENSYNAKGAIVSDIWRPNVSNGLKNVYATDSGNYVDSVIVLGTQDMQGLDALTVMPLGSAFVATDAYPALKMFKGIDECFHSYDNACDAECNDCGDVRIPANHVYTNRCDATCNECGATRTVYHAYSNRCDDTCNTEGCGATRTVYHVYDYVCDIDCNECGAERAAEKHRYDNECDETCNVCGGERIVPTRPVVPSVTPSFSVNGATLRAGETFTATISVNNNPGICSLQVSVGYDASILELVSATGGVFAGTSFGPMANVPFMMIWTNALELNTTNGTVATLTFKVKEDAPVGYTEIALSYDPNNVYDFDFENVYFETVNNFVEIIDYIPGDVNEDGIVNNKDVGELQRYMVGWDIEINNSAADVNKDGVVNNRDIGIIQRYLNGWDVELK